MHLPPLVALPAIVAFLGVIAAAPVVGVAAVPILVAAITAGPNYLALRKNGKETTEAIGRVESKLDRHLEAHANGTASPPSMPVMVAEVVRLDDRR